MALRTAPRQTARWPGNPIQCSQRHAWKEKDQNFIMMSLRATSSSGMRLCVSMYAATKKSNQ